MSEPNKEREAFEAWAGKWVWLGNPDAKQASWEAWQARANHTEDSPSQSAEPVALTEREIVELAVENYIHFPRNRNLLSFVDAIRATPSAATGAQGLTVSGSDMKVALRMLTDIDELLCKRIDAEPHGALDKALEKARNVRAVLAQAAQSASAQQAEPVVLYGGGLTPVSFDAATSASAPECSTCGGFVHVHDATGEYRGECPHCTVPAPSASPVALTDEHILAVVDACFDSGYFAVDNSDWIKFARAIRAAMSREQSQQGGE